MSGMKVSFDGLRKQIARDYNKIAYELSHANDPEDVAERMQELRRSISCLLCCYDDKCPDDINDLSEIADTLIRIDE